MGYFDLKATCSFCHTNLNLLTCKSRLELKDGWICSKCVKKIGGWNSVKRKKTTVNDIKKAIDIKTSSPISSQNTNSKQNNINKHSEKVFTFKVSGVSFDDDTGKNRQTIIKHIIKQGIKMEYLTAYNDISNKEMIEDYINPNYYVAGQYIKSTKLETSKYNNEEAIKVYISDYEDNYYHIGWVPHDDIYKVLTILQSNNTIKIYSEFIGGKYKEIWYDDINDQEKIKTNTDLSYGIKVIIKIK